MLGVMIGAVFKHGSASDQYIGAAGDDVARGLRIDAAIDFKIDLAAAGVAFEETDSFLPAIAEADAVYMTRIQDEYDVVVVGAGSGRPDSGDYPDIDMTFGEDGYLRKDGTPYGKGRTP